MVPLVSLVDSGGLQSPKIESDDLQDVLSSVTKGFLQQPNTGYPQTAAEHNPKRSYRSLTSSAAAAASTLL